VVRSTCSNLAYTTGFGLCYTYRIEGDGTIHIQTDVEPLGQLTGWIPKMGLQMDLPDNFADLQWYGRGPQENYPDRKSGYRMGVYQSDADSEYVPYLIPQDYGNKSDVIWASVSNDTGIGLRVVSEEQFNVSLQKYSTANLERARYPFQLKERESLTLSLDHAVSGVGGTAVSVMNRYRVLPGTFSFDFTLIPFRK